MSHGMAGAQEGNGCVLQAGVLVLSAGAWLHLKAILVALMCLNAALPLD